MKEIARVEFGNSEVEKERLAKIAKRRRNPVDSMSPDPENEFNQFIIGKKGNALPPP